jgi:hypothetical protein
MGILTVALAFIGCYDKKTALLVLLVLLAFGITNEDGRLKRKSKSLSHRRKRHKYENGMG